MLALQVSSLHMCTCNKQGNKLEKKGTKEIGEHAKNILTKGAKRGQTKHAKHIKGQTSMLSSKRGCPRRKNVDLDRVSIVPLDWSIDNT